MLFSKFINKIQFSFLSVIILAVFVFIAVPRISFAAQNTLNLGSAVNFAILSKAGISDIPTSIITGNIGSSPVTSSSIQPVCSEVTGTIYGSDAAYTGNGNITCFAAGTAGEGANKTLVNNAIADMESAYTYAASRVLPDATDVGTGGNISGLSFAPGLYKWNTGVMIDNRSITLNGGANDVWVFQIAGDLLLNNDARINLTGGAQAKNIYWQVGGINGATLGMNTVFNGTILSANQISLQAGAVLNGRAFSQNQVSLQSNRVTLPIEFKPVITADVTDLGCISGNTFSITTGNKCPATAVNSNTSGSSLPALITSPSSFSSSAGSIKDITINLKKGSKSSDVKILQEFLIKENKGPAAKALSKHVLTNNFGSLTKEALVEYQKSAGLTPADGVFGPKTRSHINKQK